MESVQSTEARDELDRLEDISAFIAEAIGCIAESAERQGLPGPKCWQGLFYLSQYLEESISRVNCKLNMK